MVDLATNPRPALRRAADHDGIGARLIEHKAGLFRTGNVAIGHHGDAHRCFHGGNGFIFGIALVAIGTRAAVQGQHLDAGLLGDAGDGQGILVGTVPARAKFQGDGHVDGVDDGVQYLFDQAFILQQGRTAPAVAHLFHGATHVDVDDLCAPVHIELGAVGQVLRIGAGDLHGFRLHFTFMVRAARAFFRRPQARIRRRHLRHGVAGTQLLAQLAERPIRHAGHGSDENVIAQNVRADLH
ncbi:hypothetical protein D3C72_1490810 [compost metagenome]